MSLKKTQQDKFNNDWYSPQASAIKRMLWYFTNVLFFINPLNPVSSLKVFLLKRFGAKIGNGVIIKPSVNIKYPWLLEIGDHTWIGENVWIDNLTEVKIGAHVCLSQGAFLLTGNHNYKKTSFDLMVGKIILEDGVWIGAKSTVCPSVTCQSHSVLAVNSVATSDLEAYYIYSGNPCIKKRQRVIE